MSFGVPRGRWTRWRWSPGAMWCGPGAWLGCPTPPFWRTPLALWAPGLQFMARVRGRTHRRAPVVAATPHHLHAAARHPPQLSALLSHPPGLPPTPLPLAAAQPSRHVRGIEWGIRLSPRPLLTCPHHLRISWQFRASGLMPLSSRSCRRWRQSARRYMTSPGIGLGQGRCVTASTAGA